MGQKMLQITMFYERTMHFIRTCCYRLRRNTPFAPAGVDFFIFFWGISTRELLSSHTFASQNASTHAGNERRIHQRFQLAQTSGKVGCTNKQKKRMNHGVLEEVLHVIG